MAKAIFPKVVKAMERSNGKESKPNGGEAEPREEFTPPVLEEEVFGEELGREEEGVELVGGRIEEDGKPDTTATPSEETRPKVDEPGDRVPDI